MAEQSKRTTLSFGGVRADVALVKMSGKPSEAKHDVQWPDDPLADKHEKETGDLAVAHAAERAAAGVDDDPLGGRGSEDNLGLKFDAEVGGATFTEPEPEPVKPRHGVLLESGEFVDLTERLAEIDERCKLEGMEVAACVPSAGVPRERVREAHWLGSGDPRSARVLRLLWHALHDSNRVAVVRWTKRTNQALGVVVPRRVAVDREPARALALLELEWAENMRPPSARVTGPIAGDVEPGELAAAVRLVEAYAAGPHAVDELRDERLAARAELLELARERGQDALALLGPPPEPAAAEEPEDLAAQWAAEAEARAQ